MSCEMLERCGFFLHFQGNTEVVKQGWVRLYCQDEAKSEMCKRKQHRMATGEPPADPMSPTGKMLSEKLE